MRERYYLFSKIHIRSPIAKYCVKHVLLRYIYNYTGLPFAVINQILKMHKGMKENHGKRKYIAIQNKYQMFNNVFQISRCYFFLFMRVSSFLNIH